MTSSKPRNTIFEGLQDPHVYVPLSEHVGPYIRTARKELKMTQAQVGKVLGLSQARMSELETNPGLMSLEQFLRLALVLDIAVYLGPRAEMRKPQEGAPEW